MPRFPYYSSSNSYIQPYSSSTDGGELVTEFNQRSQLNVIGWKRVDISKSKPKMGTGTYYSWMSGCKDEDSLKLSIVGSYLRIAPGEALICGYYGDFLEEITIPTSEIISAADMGTNHLDDYVKTRYVKVQVTTTQSTGNRHDERLVPPLDHQYLGVEIVIDDTLPQLNQLLLGTISRNTVGAFSVINNSFKTGFISIDHISGAENYGELVAAPEDDASIYGVLAGGEDEEGNVNNLININEWTWLAYSSVLGKYLRNMAKVPDDAGSPGGGTGTSDLEMLGSIVGWVSEIHDGPSSDYVVTHNQMLRVYLRNSNIGGQGGDPAKPYIAYRVLIDGQKAPDCYKEEYAPLPFATYQNHYIPDTVPPYNDAGYLIGRNSGIITAETLWQIDQLWQDRDSASAGTAYSGRQFGPFQTKAEADAWVEAQVASGRQNFPLQGDYYWVLSDTIDNYANPHDLSVDYGTVSATYTANTSGDVTASFNQQTITGGTTMTGEVTGTFSGDMETQDGNNTTIPVSGDLTAQSLTVSTSQTVEINEIQGKATGSGTGTATFKLKSFTQNVSVKYMYLPNDYFDRTQGYEWKKQQVVRGFACPGTPIYYGYLRPSDGNHIGDVINDPDKNQLRLNNDSIEMIENGGWRVVDDPVNMILLPSLVSYGKITNYWYKGGATFTLQGAGWDADTLPALRRLRGDITIDISGCTMAEGATAAIQLEDVDHITLVVGTRNNKINIKNCTIAMQNFNHVYRWQTSVFDTGSNVAPVYNPWMTVENAFSDTYENSLQVRFATITRGEYDVVSAEMDVWIKRADWTTPGSQEDLQMVSIDKLKFPPLYFRLDDAGNPINVELIPDSLNAKVSGTGGTHRSWDATQSRYVMTGNWISTMDWEDGEEFSLNGRMLSPAGDRLHGLYDVRFRACVQFTHADDMMEESVDYNLVYPS